MKARLTVAGLIFLLAGMPAAAHRLDEYLQATLIAIGKDSIHLQMRLTPGIAILPLVLPSIDTNADGVISDAEQRFYVQLVLSDLSLIIDGAPARLRLDSLKFATMDQMKAGLGEIQLELSADTPRGGAERKLVFENRHEGPIAAYQVNALVPRDPDLRIAEQNRNYHQSLYQLHYQQGGAGSGPGSWWPGAGGWMGVAALLMFASPALLLLRRPRAAPLN